MTESEKKPSVIKDAAAMSAGTIFSRVLGYVRDAVMLAVFSRTITDAFLVAFRFPNLVRRLLGEGSLSVSFIPVYVEQLEKEKTGERAKQLANAIYTLLALVTSSLAILAYIFMTPIMKVWVGGDGGFESIPGKMELTVYLAQIMIIYVILVTSYAFVMGMANAHRKFFMPAVAPAVFNLAIIIAAALPQNILSIQGAVLAWGVVVGGVLQFLLVAIQLYQIGHLPKLTMKIKVPGLKTVLTNFVPGLLGLGVYQVMTIANTFFAARLPEGTQSYIYAADRILELPQSIIAVSLGTALLPLFSRQLAAGQKDKMLESANEGLRAMLFLALPAALGMAVLGRPIIHVLFMRGAFGQEDVLVTSQITQVYSVVLLASSLTKVTVPGFYAMKNTWMPATIAGVCLLMHLICAQILVGPFGVVGLASSTAITGALNMILLSVAFRFMIGPIGYQKIFKAVFQMLPALGLMAGFLSVTEFFWGEKVSIGWGVYGAGLFLSLQICAAVLIYFVVASASGSPEAARTIGVLRRRGLKVKQRA